MSAQLWAGMESEMSPDSCRELADLAEWLDRTNIRGQQELTDAIAGRDEEPCPATRRVAASIVGKIVVTHAGGFGRAAFALRILGVFVCVRLDRPQKCPCWRAMVKRYGLEPAREHLRAGLPGDLSA